MKWSPAQYDKFQKERYAPFVDALALVAGGARWKVIDLGCGTGELTRKLADALPDCDALGVDGSDDMLEKAKPFARDGVRFERRTIEDFVASNDTFDLVFSHAAIQWVDDHAGLVPALFSRVRPGGQLVVQLPSNHGHATHLEIASLAGTSPFVEALGGYTRPSPVLSIDRYAELLHHAGGRDLVVFEKAFPHVLDDADALAEWTRGTAMLPYLARLPTELHAPFMDRYRARLRERFPERPVFYPFRRTFFAARKPAA